MQLKRLYLVFIVGIFCQYTIKVQAQTAWPSIPWTSGVNLTPVMDPVGLTDISGLFWNEVTKRLYVSNGNGGLRVLQLNTTTNTFAQIANRSYTAGPEGITQVNLSANEYYTIDEDNYQIRKYTHPADFSSLTLSKSWNIVASPSPMTNTGNTGPEGITFVPDSFLSAIGFISQASGLPYTSVKGLGGLFFIAHQNQGYIWVFDVNPNLSNDFAYVGKYKTNKSESCELSFDRTTGLLYILHNTLGNFIEVTNLTSSIVTGGDRKFTVNNEYYVSNPTGNQNIEGFTIMSKCSDSTHVSAWLCRDVELTELAAYRQDCVRWFSPFNAPGTCGNTSPVTVNLRVFIQGYYKSTGVMQAVINGVNYPTLCDSITLELHATTGQHALVQSVKGTIDVNGYGNFVFSPTIFLGSYYLVVRHRSALEVWSTSPVLFNSLSVSYSFTDAIGKAYGNQLYATGDGTFSLYNGDINQDGVFNISDFNSVESKTRLFTTGYLKEDLNGDHLIENSDYILVENNSRLQIAVSRP